MDKKDLKVGTRCFGVEVIRFSATLPNEMPYWVIGKQLVRSATSVGANYRSACRGKSRKDFIAKLAIVEEEADESQYWLELLDTMGGIDGTQLRSLHREAGELTAIMVASRKTARAHS